MALLFQGRGEALPADHFAIPDVVQATSGSRYEVAERIGAGGNGVVHRCVDLATGLDYAAKFQLDLRKDRRQRFIREQTLTAELAHDHLIKYIAHGSVDGNHIFRGGNSKPTTIPFIIMELAQGSLSELVHNSDIPKEVYYSQFRGLANALGILHTRAFHRDIKPENILVIGDRWVLSDYGLCDPFDCPEDERLTPDWAIIGPRFWMSPEANNRSVGRGDSICAASDVFQLASVFWYVVTKNHPTGVLDRNDWTGPEALFRPVHIALHHKTGTRPPDGSAFAAAIEAAILS